MKIRHQYNSATPYESCGYEIIPSYPCVGEKPLIQCRTEPYTAGQVLSLRWSINGVAQQAITGDLCHVDEEGRGYYSFALPELTDSLQIDYTIQAKIADKTTTSEAFSFTPRTVEKAKEQVQLWRYENVLLFLIKIGTGSFYWRWDIGGNSIAMCIFEKSVPPTEPFAKLTDELIIIECNNGRHIEIQENPFAVRIFVGVDCVLSLSGSDVALVLDHTGSIRRILLNAKISGEAFYGLGERFNAVNQLNHSAKAYSYEKFTNQGEKSYLPIPFFVSDKGFGVLHQSTYQSDYTFSQYKHQEGQTAQWTFSAWCGDNRCISKDVLFFGNISEIVSGYIGMTGKPALPPKWSFGPWMSSNRWENQTDVEQQLSAMERYEIPATVLVIERWSDDTTFDCFEDVPRPTVGGGESLSCKDFNFSGNTRWSDPVGMAQQIHRRGLKLILWQAPIIRKPPHKVYPQCDHDYAYAIEKKYCVMMPDGTPYQCAEGWFKDALLVDFTNKNAVSWWMSKRAWLLNELHADGFKTDSGELVSDDRCVFSNGKTGAEMRNVYPMYYESAYADFLRDNGVEGVNLTRAGYYGAQKYPIHWTGDQKSTFPELRAQLKATLSAGLSGVLFMGTDLAGFAGELPTGELYRRGVSFAAFSGLMQFHSEPTNCFNNDRSPWNMAACLHDPSIIDHYRRYAEVRMSLIPYLYSESRYCVECGRPLMAHLMFDFQQDSNVKNIEDSYMLGHSLLVAPIVHEGSVGREIYFPSGQWVDLFSGKIFSSGTQFYSCSRSDIPVFLKQGDMLPFDLAEKHLTCSDETIKNIWTQNGRCLSFLHTGDGKYQCSCEGENNHITVTIKETHADITTAVPGCIACFSLAGSQIITASVNGSQGKIAKVTFNNGRVQIAGVIVSPQKQ